MDLTPSAGLGRALVMTAALVVILAGLKMASVIVVPLLLATFIAIVANGPIDWLKTYRFPTWLAMVTVLSVFLLLLVGIGAVVAQSANEFVQNQGSYEAKLQTLVDGMFVWLNNLGIPISFNTIREQFMTLQIMSVAGQTVGGIGSAISNGFLILLVFIFILAEGTGLTRKVHALLPQPDGEELWVDQFATKINRYIAIKTAVSVTTGLLVTLGLSIIGVDFPVLWGMVAFMFNYIPNIGSIIAAAPVVLLALIQVGVPGTVWVVILYVMINVVMGSVVEPRFMGRSLGLSALVVFLSLVFWGWMFGPVGMLLSVPLTMTVKIAAETRPETQWLSVLLGPNTISAEPIEE